MISNQKHALKLSRDYTQANFAWILSLIVTLLLLVNSFNFKEGTLKGAVFTVFLVYLVFTVFQLFLTWKMKRDLLNTGEIQSKTRKLGYIQLLSILSANIFIASFAFNIIKKKKTPEYTFAVYMLLTQIFILAISSLNLFKPYVTDTFLPAMGILIGILIFQVITLVLVSKHVEDNLAPSWMMAIAILLITTSLTGNIFNLLLGISLIVKVRSHDQSRILKWNTMWSKITRNSTAILGMFFIILMFSLSVCSKFTFDYDMAVENNYGELLQNPSLEHPFGTDNFGRDLFSRIVFGARISLIVGFASTIIPAIIGGFLGALAGYYTKRADNVIMRLLDILYAIPGILLAIAIIAAFGANTMNLILALSVGSIPTYARTMRANVLMVSNYEFVDSARALGSSDLSIIFKQIVPNSLAPMIVKATLTIGGAVIATSSLSFLGLGVEPHIPEWGNILKIGSTYLESHSYLAVIPGLAIIGLVLSFNFLGDGLRDAFDPRMD
ncbi:peptide ABC transporter permease [Bacillus sp. FJAT-22090]|uniref:ABC transporter permease n=1 Tax=Bacillus sp. FJAT-22090 TaxID=1581038 RepID=UPI0006B040F0|nr:ABC transporter permease [Bacillus sp. FJAT-22090]ALC86667.1 peptide ABC transporter permease [Bacillus sp. FJAT-22090]